jgi:hypothetical protein
MRLFQIRHQFANAWEALSNMSHSTQEENMQKRQARRGVFDEIRARLETYPRNLMVGLAYKTGVSVSSEEL